jgi:hypothetical protein
MILRMNRSRAGRWIVLTLLIGGVSYWFGRWVLPTPSTAFPEPDGHRPPSQEQAMQEWLGLMLLNFSKEPSPEWNALESIVAQAQTDRPKESPLPPRTMIPYPLNLLITPTPQRTGQWQGILQLTVERARQKAPAKTILPLAEDFRGPDILRQCFRLGSHPDLPPTS